MPRLNKPSRKQKQFAKVYVQKKFNGRQAALEVYDVKESNAHALAQATLKNPVVVNLIEEEMSKAGLTKEYLNNVMYEAIEINKQGKPSQAVLAQLLIQAHKIYNYIPKSSKVMIKEERKELLGRDYNHLKSELATTITTTQELLKDL